MLKKILLGVFLVVVIVLLGVGAWIRTSDKIVATSNGRGQGQGHGYNRLADPLQSGTSTWQTVEGSVVKVDSVAAILKTPSGEQYSVENRPWSFALEQRFSAQVGDQIKIEGYNENGIFVAAQLQNMTNGKTVQLRDKYGRPGWSGQGRIGSGG